MIAIRGAWAAAFVSLIFSLLFWYVPGMHNLEARFLDWMFVERYQVGQAPPVDPRILIIGVDDDTYTYLGKPSVFWVGDFARAANALVESGASVVGLDYSPSPRADKLPEVQALLLEGQIALLQAIVTSGKVLLGYLPAQGEHQGVQADADLMEAADEVDNLVSLGLITDPDGVHRSLALFGTSVNGETIRKSLTCRAIEVGTGQSLLSPPPHPLPLPPLVWEGSPLNPHLRINYPGPHGTFPVLSMASVLRDLEAGRKPPVDGRICLIADWSVASQDFRTTPFNLMPHQDIFGIEVHAAAINTILTGRYIRVLPLPGAILITVLFGTGLFLVAFKRRLVSSLVWGLLLMLGYTLFEVQLFIRAGYWGPWWSVMAAGLLSYLWGFILRYRQAEQSRRATRNLFSRMVSPEVVNLVLSHPEDDVPRSQRVTVLYTDINDFTPMCEQRQPREVMDMLNRYFEAMVAIIINNKGTLKQFVGDEIMCIYGAPHTREDDAARAVNTALEMLECLQQMAAADPEGNGFYDIKVGIHTGDVVVGRVGSKQHQEYAAVGDDVNLGARIMATTKKLNCKVLVSEVTRREAQARLPHVEWISHGVQSFKGKTAQMEVFEIRRRQPSAAKETHDEET